MVNVTIYSLHGSYGWGKCETIVYFPNKKTTYLPGLPNSYDLVLSTNSRKYRTSTIISRCVSWYKPNWYWSYVNQLRWGTWAVVGIGDAWDWGCLFQLWLGEFLKNWRFPIRHGGTPSYHPFIDDDPSLKKLFQGIN